MAQLRPARFHSHAPQIWPGEDDVHGSAPRPRYGEFPREPGTTYVAYADDDEVRDVALMQISAIYMPGYAQLFAGRPAFEFKFAGADHWIYNGVAAPIEPDETAVLWWRRPIRTLRQMDDYTFPRDLDTAIRLFSATTREYACTGFVRAFDQAGGRAATGYVVVDVTQIGWSPDIRADLEDAFTKK